MTIKPLNLAAALLAAPLLACPLLVGCAGDGRSNEQTHIGSKNDPHDTNAKVPSIEANYEMVALGRPPLSFMTISGGYVKIVDETSGEIVHTAQVAPTAGGTLIRLDPELKAVTYGPPFASEQAGKPQIVQAIDPTHRFELYYQR